MPFPDPKKPYQHQNQETWNQKISNEHINKEEGDGPGQSVSLDFGQQFIIRAQQRDWPPVLMSWRSPFFGNGVRAALLYLGQGHIIKAFGNDLWNIFAQFRPESFIKLRQESIWIWGLINSLDFLWTLLDSAELCGSTVSIYRCQPLFAVYPGFRHKG